MISEQPQGAVLRLGKVVKVHPSDHSVDLVMMDNGAKMANVQLLAPTASTRSGRVDLPTPDSVDDENPWSLKMSETQDLLAAIAMMGGTPICIGFLYPQANELAMPEGTQNLRIDRHASDFYQTIDDSAVMTMHHPGGAYLSIGGGYNVLDGKDFDQKWKINRNIRSVEITIRTPDGSGSIQGETVGGDSDQEKKEEESAGGSTIVCAPKKITLETGGFISASAQKDISATAGTDITITANGNILIKANGTVTVKGATIRLN